MDPFHIFVLLADEPLLALLPAALFLLPALLLKRRAFWFAASVWLLYAMYEFAISQRILCSGECNIRADLLLIAPVLLTLTMWAVFALIMTGVRARSRTRGIGDDADPA